MKNKKNDILLIGSGLILLLAYLTYPWFLTAGGVGSLASYEFNVHRDILSSKIDSLILNDNKVGIPSKAIYNLDGTGYEDNARYIYIIENDMDTLVYSYKFSQRPSENNTIIALTHYGKYGEDPLKTSRDIFFFRRKSKANGFEKILNRLSMNYTNK